MAQLLGLFLVALTFPIWAGAFGAAIGAGFYLLVNHTVVFLALGGGFLLLSACA